MAKSKTGNISPVPSESAAEKNPKVFETATSTPAPVYHQHGWLNGIKSVLLAKAPAEGAPFEFGGHRIAEEPRRQGFGGVLAKFARFFGPGMILTVAYVDPDNFQTSISDGQDFGYKMQFMVLFSLVLAIYLQVSVFASKHRASPLYHRHHLMAL
jgi:hypothetical protein